MEYKRDRRDGRFYMVEPTVGRTDFQEEVATVNGVNIPLAAYRHEVRVAPVHVERVSLPRLWRESVIDRWAQEGRNQPSVESAIPHRTVDAYFRWTIPVHGSTPCGIVSWAQLRTVVPKVHASATAFMKAATRGTSNTFLAWRHASASDSPSTR